METGCKHFFPIHNIKKNQKSHVESLNVNVRIIQGQSCMKTWKSRYVAPRYLLLTCRNIFRTDQCFLHLFPVLISKTGNV